MDRDLEKDIAKGYNALMSGLMKAHGGRYGATQLRLLVAEYLVGHAIAKAREAVQKAVEPSDRINRLIGLMAAGQTPQAAARLIQENDGLSSSEDTPVAPSTQDQDEP